MSEVIRPLPSFAREGKPRDRGLTIADDTLAPIERGFLDHGSEYVDWVKIGQSLPLIVDRSRLLERIRYYHDLGIRVMSGGTLLQVALKKGLVPEILDRIRSLNFDTVEISESVLEISPQTKQELIDKISSRSMDYIFEIGSKESNKYSDGGGSVQHLISKAEEAIELKSPRVIIEAGPLGAGSGIYDQSGEISWENLNELVGKFGPPRLVFEAPYIAQRISLVLEFGPGVNLASVPLNEILLLEMQRLGLTTETLGLSPSVHSLEGSPASKFVYYLIRTEHPIEQAALIQKSGLPRRTLQAALSYLIEKGLVREVPDLSDLRKHKYTPR